MLGFVVQRTLWKERKCQDHLRRFQEARLCFPWRCVNDAKVCCSALVPPCLKRFSAGWVSTDFIGKMNKHGFIDSSLQAQSSGGRSNVRRSLTASWRLWIWRWGQLTLWCSERKSCGWKSNIFLPSLLSGKVNSHHLLRWRKSFSDLRWEASRL